MPRKQPGNGNDQNGESLFLNVLINVCFFYLFCFLGKKESNIKDVLALMTKCLSADVDRRALCAISAFTMSKLSMHITDSLKEHNSKTKWNESA